MICRSGRLSRSASSSSPHKANGGTRVMATASSAMSPASAPRNRKKSGLRPTTSSSGWATTKPVRANNSSSHHSRGLTTNHSRAQLVSRCCSSGVASAPAGPARHPPRNRKGRRFESDLGLQNHRSEYVWATLVARLACLVDHPLVREPGLREVRPASFVGVRPINRSPVDGPPSSAHDERNRGRRTIGPARRAGRASRAIRENQFAAAPPWGCQPWVAAESMRPRYGAHGMPVTPRPSNRNTWPAWGWRSSAASSSPARAVVTNSVASSAPPNAQDVG
jgi:hypothetical protein